ncbi:fungal-specific transcription factor domain-containing protein [Xylaria bambusicola]|uniref:fungal-specific transcription factor domain-containing protein n=1 Tax=Xylaria bambusicola TaxID=326684 RepID=UPI002008B42A|nr:fungal-specific transcription factor domain-containing protein [Xylaria bambusicola]KAI0526709.1 fungal-specific transcription factor domain-containing protein [Xylaria bambusicola]
MQTVQVSQDGGLQLQHQHQHQQQSQTQTQPQSQQHQNHHHHHHHHHQPQHHQNRRAEDTHHNSRSTETGAGAGAGSGTIEHDSDDGNALISADENDIEEDHGSPGALRNGKRKRPISVSCETCKQRKVKCDRGQPSCGWCRRNSVSCEYRERKKPGLRAGYGRELEQRLDRLEEILRSHSEILNTTFISSSPTHHGLPPPSVRNSNPSIPSDHGTPREPTSLFRPNESLRTPQAETALFIQKPISFSAAAQGPDFGIPPTTSSMHSVNDGYSTHIQPAGISPSSHLSTTLQPSAAAQDYYGQPHQQALPSPGLSVTQSQTQISSETELPPYDLLYALADLYFKHINTWCPILHRKTTLDSLFGPSTLDEADRVLLHAIVATTLRFSTDARLTEERRRHYHDVSKQRVLLYGLDNSSVKSLQALVILALDLCGSSNGPPGWNIMALITRSVVQLGLAVESNSLSVSPHYASIYTLRAMVLPEPKDFIEEESRRRLFWMIYLLDRYATIATAFDFGLADKDIDRTLPCRDDLWIKNQKIDTRWFNSSSQDQQSPLDHQPDHEINRPENLGAFSYYIEILGILSKIHQFLRKPVDIGALNDVEQWQLQYKDLDNMLSSWKFGLPGEYGNMAKLFQPGCGKTLNAGWVMLHATYHTAVIRLHSSAAYPTTRSPIFTPSYSASQRCHGAVENIAALGEFVVQNAMLTKLGPPFAFTLWVAARLLLVHGSTVEHKLAPQIAFLVDTLREMGRYWPVAARYCKLLQRVLDEHSDSERAVGQTGERVTPSSVKILADMRRTAFDLDFLISRQPRHVIATNGNGGVGGGSAASRMPSVTPARTPAPNELEYLDVFDFFNVPRLPMSHENSAGPPGSSSGGVGGGENMNVDSGLVNKLEAGGGGGVPNEFNITNFMMDASSDWLFKATP